MATRSRAAVLVGMRSAIGLSSPSRTTGAAPCHRVGGAGAAGRTVAAWRVTPPRPKHFDAIGRPGGSARRLGGADSPSLQALPDQFRGRRLDGPSRRPTAADQERRVDQMSGQGHPALPLGDLLSQPDQGVEGRGSDCAEGDPGHGRDLDHGVAAGRGVDSFAPEPRPVRVAAQTGGVQQRPPGG
jgi:hypothetical protein